MPTQSSAAPFTRLFLFVFGFLASFLPLIRFSDTWLAPFVIGLFALLAFTIVVYALSLVGEEKKGGRDTQRQSWARWLTLSMAVLGVGLGIAAYIFKGHLRYFIGKYVVLDTYGELILASLLFLGVIMGFFIVRNWSKSQEDFITSLTAVLGGAFISTLLGQVTGISLLASFAHYALGFTVSGGINLFAFSMLVARYSTTESKASRSVIDFLYGSDKAEKIDQHFLRNFEEDTDYAKRLLVRTLTEYRDKVLDEYANKMQSKRVPRPGQPPPQQPPPQQPPQQPPGQQQPPQQPPQPLPPLNFYRLLSINCVPEPAAAGAAADAEDEEDAGAAAAAAGAGAAGAAAGAGAVVQDPIYLVLYQQLAVGEILAGRMFRMGITVKIAESLDYILSPGEYRKPFPFYGSIAGLSLRTRQTIVMDRDMDKKFRHEGAKDGECPRKIEHARGLDEIDYLSYVSVPVVSRLGNKEEVALGVFNVDTKLFAAPAAEIAAKAPNLVEPAGPDGVPGPVFIAKFKKSDLAKWAGNLYTQNDEAVKYLEQMRAVIVPLLELYLKCRVGAP